MYTSYRKDKSVYVQRGLWSTRFRVTDLKLIIPISQISFESLIEIRMNLNLYKRYSFSWFVYSFLIDLPNETEDVQQWQYLEKTLAIEFQIDFMLILKSLIIKKLNIEGTCSVKRYLYPDYIRTICEIINLNKLGSILKINDSWRS